MKKAALLTTIILIISIAGASQAASTSINTGNEELDDEIGLYLQDTGEWVCTSEIDGTVSCDSV